MLLLILRTASVYLWISSTYAKLATNGWQVWNHDFFWESMQSEGGKTPSGGVLHQIEKDFGSFEKFREEFVEAALTLFGSGWVWLVCELSR